jgi:signal transduction histidine kinase
VSFRRRLLAASLATLAVGLGALLIAGNVLLSHRVGDETEGLLSAHAQAQVAALDVTADGVRPRETPNDQQLDREAWILSGGKVIERPAAVAPAVDRLAVALGRARRTAEVEAPGDLKLRSEPVGRAGAVVVALSTAPLERLQQEVLIGSLIVALAVLAFAFVAIRSAIDGALRPVAMMTAQAEDWGAHELDHRFGLGPPRDELTGLAATLDGLLGRIAASRRHEQRFASEVAHELRTPIAGVRARAEFALGGDDEAELRAALKSVVAQAARLDETIATLMAVARQELDPSSGSVDLGELAREVEDVELSAPPSLPHAEGEPEVVRAAIAPLVENARRHAVSTVRLELSAHHGRVRLTVRDDGPGLAPGLRERAFEPGGRNGGGGAGLGLPLARRLARSCGGDVVAGPGPGGCFVLELPAIGAPVR